MELQFLYALQELHTPFLDTFLSAVTFLGNKGWFFIALGAVLFLIPKTRRMGLCVLLSLFFGLVIGNIVLKNLVMRPRPCWIDPAVPLVIAVPHDFSFPSGHSLASFETAVSVLYYHRGWGIALLILAGITAFSRLYLFVHFPTDVAAGIAIGIFNAWLAHRLLEKHEKGAIL